jgi:drug/metabolite transporter (DMT)-like permease
MASAAGPNRARVLLFFSAVFYGVAALFARIATRPGGMSGAETSLIRFAVGTVAVGAIFVARPGTLHPRNYWLLAARGVFGGLSGMLYFKGIALTSAGEATLLNNTFPMWGVIVSFFFLRERPTLHLVLALLVASAGVFLVVGGGATHVHLGTGQVLALVSGVSGGLAVTAIRALRSNHNAATIFFSFSIGGLLASSPALGESWPTGAAPWLAAGAVGLASFLAQILMTEAYGPLTVAEAGVWQQLTPIASFAWGLTLGEGVTLPTLVGVTLGVAGIVYATALGHKPVSEPTEP